MKPDSEALACGASSSGCDSRHTPRSFSSAWIEYLATNEKVAGSNPARSTLYILCRLIICPRGLTARIPPFQGGGAGSIPVGGTQASRVIFVAFGSWHGVMLFLVMVTNYLSLHRVAVILLLGYRYSYPSNSVDRVAAS